MKERLRAGMPFFGFMICPMLTLILTEYYTHNPFVDMKWILWILNLIIYWLITGLLFFATGQLRMALWIQTVLFMIAGLANYYVIAFRDSPILPWDIFSVGTAASVADNFNYALPLKICFIVAGFILLLLAEWKFSYSIRMKKTRVVGVIALTGALWAFGTFLQQENVMAATRPYDTMFVPSIVQKENGLAGAFAMELKYLKVEEPEGYDAEECKALLESDEEKGTVVKKQPHIIVIMNEAFADMSYLGEFTTNKDYMPFFNSLIGSEDTISGRLHVSVLGGNTANTEFEFLTGNTMVFLPPGSIPYQQYLKGKVPSLASELKAQGYATVAMHPYYETGWSRNEVYSRMGFDAMRFIEDYADAEYIRKYVSDRSDYKTLIKEYEEREREKPLFIFNVTMQNHGGYGQEFDNFSPEIEAKEIKSQALSNYLSLISLSDEALAELIGYFEKEEEEVLLVFFGDHQPNDTVAAPIRSLQGMEDKELTQEQEAARYEVPFLIWANYDIEEKQDIKTSANFLALEVFRQTGITPKGYYRYLEELEKSYPVISTKQLLTGNGEVLFPNEWEKAEELQNYQKLQYYRMFDSE